MKTLLIYLPFYVPLVGLFGWFIRHERQHARYELLMRQVCVKLKIETGGRI